ncbi:IS701 family transposase [Halorubrum trueperi]|uniref:IS701 family transposase n=1 Tax=Halorubrum trueperi TaxID=2004704 RepID=A0ABD5UNL7_9EURY
MEATPIADVLSCTDFVDEFNSLSYHQRWHVKTYTTGLVGSSNKTIEGIANRVLPAKDERTLNNFLNDYDWDERRLNQERIDLLQDHDDTRMSKKGVVALDDTLNDKSGKHIPGTDWFYDHNEGHTVWSQNLVFSLYADQKTSYPLDFRLVDKDGPSKIDLAKQLIDQAEAAGVPAATYVYDAWFSSKEVNEHVESYDKDWITLLPVNRKIKYDGEWLSVDELYERVELVERTVDDETYRIWTQKRLIKSLDAEKKVLLVEPVEEDDDEIDEEDEEAADEEDTAETSTDDEESEEEDDGDEDEDDEPEFRCLVTNKIDAPAAHLIRLYTRRWRIETFFRDSRQDLGLGDCEVRNERGAKRHWHLVMLAYSLLRLGISHSALGRAISTASSIRGDLKHALKESIYDLFHWAVSNAEGGLENLMQEVEGVFI